MRLLPIVGGVLLYTISVISYYYAPHFLSDTAHSFVASMSGGSTMNGVSMLRQMGYPSLHVVITAFQYLSIGLAITGLGLVGFGLVAKKIPKPIAVKVAVDERFEKSYPTPQPNGSKTAKRSQTSAGNEQVAFEVVNDVLTKLETELKDIKTGYEEHKQQMNDERKKLEQVERERMAKIIATGEVLIKEITPDKFEERIKYYVGLKNENTEQPIDLSLLAEKFDKMKKTLNSAGRSDLTPKEFDDFKRFLE